LLGNLSVEQVTDTQFIQISYRDSDPERARQIANAVGAATSEQTSEVAPGNSFVTAVLWETAEEPVAPASPDPFRNGVLALMLGLMLGLGLALLLEYLDDSWRSPEEIEGVSGVPNFGVVPKFESPRKSRKRAEKKGSVHQR
jgi:capsular polysaccharide biosynthesis protein